jgi:hypothetical protein
VVLRLPAAGALTLILFVRHIINSALIRIELKISWPMVSGSWQTEELRQTRVMGRDMSKWRQIKGWPWHNTGTLFFCQKVVELHEI